MKVNYKPLPAKITRAVWALGLAMLIGGCSSYRLQGVVAEGEVDQPTVMVVSRDNSQLDRPGLADARIHATLDPNTKPIDAGTTVSNGQGRFSLPIEHGAGILLYKLHVAVTRRGYQHAERILSLPANRKRLLILLPPGKDQWKPQKGVVEQTLEMGNKQMEGADRR